MKNKLEITNSLKKDNEKEIKKSRYECNSNIILFLLIMVINLFVLIIMVVFIIYLFLTPLILQGRNIDEYYNNYCQREKKWKIL